MHGELSRKWGYKIASGLRDYTAGTPLRDVGKTFDSGGTVYMYSGHSEWVRHRPKLGGTYPRCPPGFYAYGEGEVRVR